MQNFQIIPYEELRRRLLSRKPQPQKRKAIQINVPETRLRFSKGPVFDRCSAARGCGFGGFHMT